MKYGKYAISVMVLTLGLFAGVQCADVSKSEDIRKTFVLREAEGKRFLLVDNINGSIHVTGIDGDVVKLVAHKSIRAESEAKAHEAEEKVTIDITEEAGRLLLYVNAPWRCRDGSVQYRGWKYYGYDVDFDFELQVPSKLNIELKTINNGDVDVKGVDGEFEVDNVNGGVELLDMKGSGKASTVNGDVRATFAGNPTGSCSFSTINGKVETEFPDDLSADLILKTFNGEAYTDFSVKDLIRKAPKYEKERRRNVYHAGDRYAVRVANGGPEISFDSLNGNIYIRRNSGSM